MDADPYSGGAHARDVVISALLERLATAADPTEITSADALIWEAFHHQDPALCNVARRALWAAVDELPRALRPPDRMPSWHSVSVR